jgi:hypothetical protein
LRLGFGSKLRKYPDVVVSWEVVANQYDLAYKLDRTEPNSGDESITFLDFQGSGVII